MQTLLSAQTAHEGMHNLTHRQADPKGRQKSTRKTIILFGCLPFLTFFCTCVCLFYNCLYSHRRQNADRQTDRQTDGQIERQMDE